MTSNDIELKGQRPHHTQSAAKDCKRTLQYDVDECRQEQATSALDCHCIV